MQQQEQYYQEKVWLRILYDIEPEKEKEKRPTDARAVAAPIAMPAVSGDFKNNGKGSFWTM